ncbi:MAG: hypothetical protein ACRBB3_04195 [Alphaproteobacteria bacterium]
MNGVKEAATTADQLDAGHNFAMVGLIIALFAFCLSVTSHWIIVELKPVPEKSEVIEQEQEVQVTKENNIFAYLLSMMSSEEIVEEEEETETSSSDVSDSKKHWTDYLSLIVIVIALGGIVNGTLGFVRENTRVIGGLAIFFGVSAIVVQHMMITFAVLILFILVVGILNSFGVSF